MNRSRRNVLRLSAATLAGGLAKGLAAEQPETAPGKRRPERGRTLVLVNIDSGLTAEDLAILLGKAGPDWAAFAETDGCIALQDAVRVLWIPEGSKFLDVELEP